MDANVTKGQMKNLITDKPSPITTKLAQINGDKDNVFKLMDANVTKGQMKNLITDKPSPITTKLWTGFAQMSNYSEEFVQGKDALVALDTTTTSSASRNSKPGAQLNFV